MDRKGAYVKRADRLTIPGVAFAVALRVAHDTARQPVGIDTQRWYGAEVSVMYRRRGRWSAPETAVVTTGDALREWMAERAIAGRTNWVVADSATDVLTLSEWWDYAEAAGIRFDVRAGKRARGRTPAGGDSRICITQFAVSGPPDIITYTHAGVRWRWCSLSNWWPDGFGDEARDTGGVGHGVSQHLRGVRVGSGRGLHESIRRLNQFRALIEWYGRIATAPLGCTAGQCAWGILRSHIAPRSLCAHSDSDVARLERSAAHGGRASVWYARGIVAEDERDSARQMLTGDTDDTTVRGPIAHVDVSSMYPWLLATRQYPVKLGPQYFGIAPNALVSLARDFGVIARVRARTRVGEYPLRTERGTIYPTGTFTTTLAGPDLERLVRDGEILRVYHVATYTLGAPFRDALQVLLNARADAKREGARDFEALSKVVANSLAGRFARREGGWVRRPALDGIEQWGETFAISDSSGALAKFRFVAGAAWQYVETALPRGPHTSVFAYLTAYGRQHMRDIRDALPARSVVAQDTDGLYLLPAGIRALIFSGTSERRGPGALRVTGSADSGIWYGPRHYRWGAKWVLAGLPYESVDERANTVTYSSRTPLFNERATSAPNCVHRIRRTVAIPSDIECGRVQPDGWILPPHKIPGRALQE